MDNSFIPYARQWIEEDDIRAVSRVLTGDWLTTGPEVDAFEKELSQFVGSRFAVSCANGTAALHLACLALKLSPKDAIVTSPITFLATANSARFVGADVMFSDICSRTANLDPLPLEKTLKLGSHKNIKAIFPVHFSGQPAQMEEISVLAKKYNVKIVEDASHALGATYRTKEGLSVRVGSCRHSDMTVFSFHPVKHVAMGEGGAVTTNDEELYERLKKLRNHGMTFQGAKGPWYYEMDELGFNYRLTDIQCALGRSQLSKIEKFLMRRQMIAHEYSRNIPDVFGEAVVPLQVLPQVTHAYHLYPVRIDFEGLGCDRADVMKKLREKGIGTQVHYIPVHLQPYYRGLYGTKWGDFPKAEAYYETALSLPMFPSMPDTGVERVIGALSSILPGDS